mgnify:FL=1
MKNLTDRQREVLDYIAQYTEENGYPPTVRETSERFGVSLRAIQDRIAGLQKKGYLSLSEKKSRSLRVLIDERTDKKNAFVAKLAVVGTVAAGKPLLSEENIERYVSVAEPLVRPGKNYFALHVRGASMINAGILEGDLAVIEQCSDADNGQIVVAMVDNAITIKRFYREANRIRLQPENPDFQPIYSQDVRIVGILAGILRSY